MSFCLSAAAHAQTYPMAEHVPASAVAYFGWMGADAQKQNYQTSDLRGFIEQSNLQQLVNQYLPKLWNKISEGSDDVQDIAGLEKALPLLWHHPVAVYAADVKIKSDGTADVDFDLICEAGADAPELQKDLQAAFHDLSHSHVSVEGSIVKLVFNDQNESEPAPTLAYRAEFKKAMSSLQKSPALAIYIDGKTMLQKADESAEKDEKTREIWPRVRDTLGIGNVNSFAMTMGFDGRNWMTASSLQAPTRARACLQFSNPDQSTRFCSLAFHPPPVQFVLSILMLPNYSTPSDRRWPPFRIQTKHFTRRRAWRRSHWEEIFGSKSWDRSVPNG